MKQLIVILIAIAGLYSCHSGTYKTWANERIDPHMREEIKKLDEQIIEAIIQNNPNLLKKYMSAALLEKSGNEVGQLVNQVNGMILNNNYRILDQYYVKNTTEGISNLVMPEIGGKDSYYLNYLALNKEMFVSLLILPANGVDEVLFTNIYGKYKDDWKLNILQFGTYSLDGMTATELYQKAKEHYEKGYLIDATNEIYLCSEASRPAEELWQYQVEDEMKEFADKIINEAKSKYQFPLTIQEIDSKPQIINIAPKGINEGYFPMVDYLTTIDLNDTAKTRIENNKIHEAIGKIFKGIDKEKKYVFYKAWNEIPDGTRPFHSYGFVKKIE